MSDTETALISRGGKPPTPTSSPASPITRRVDFASHSESHLRPVAEEDSTAYDFVSSDSSSEDEDDPHDKRIHRKLSVHKTDVRTSIILSSSTITLLQKYDMQGFLMKKKKKMQVRPRSCQHATA